MTWRNIYHFTPTLRIRLIMHCMSMSVTECAIHPSTLAFTSLRVKWIIIRESSSNVSPKLHIKKNYLLAVPIPCNLFQKIINGLVDFISSHKMLCFACCERKEHSRLICDEIVSQFINGSCTWITCLLCGRNPSKKCSVLFWITKWNCHVQLIVPGTKTRR